MPIIDLTGDGYRHQSPCPSCGHCPSCGRGGISVLPWVPYPPQPYFTTTGTSGNDTTFTVTS